MQSAAIARFAAAVRELEELEPRETFFVPFSWGLSFHGIDTSPWHGDPNVLGWVITAEDRLEPVSRARGLPPAPMLVLSAQPRSTPWGSLRVRKLTTSPADLHGRSPGADAPDSPWACRS